MTMMNPSAPRAASVPGGRTPPPNAATSQRTLTVVDRGGSSGTANRPGNNSGKVGGVAVSSGRYVNAILSILNHPTVVAPKNDESTVSSSERRHERKRQCIQTLDRLVPPLFYYSRNNYCDLDGGEDAQCSSRNENHNLTHSSYLATLRQQLSHYKLQNQRLCDRRMSVFHSLVELHECYETGLDGIARLNDLRYVPDNVMMDRPSSKS